MESLLFVAPLYGGWLVFVVLSAALVPGTAGRLARAGSAGLLFGPALGAGCGLAPVPAALGLLLALEPGLRLTDRLFLGGLALLGAAIAAVSYVGVAGVVRGLLRPNRG